MSFIDKYFKKRGFVLFVEEPNRISYITEPYKDEGWGEFCILANLTDNDKPWRFTCWRNTGHNPEDMVPIGLKLSEVVLLYFKTIEVRIKNAIRGMFGNMFVRREKKEALNDRPSYETIMKNKKTVEFGKNEKEYDNE